MKRFRGGGPGLAGCALVVWCAALAWGALETLDDGAAIEAAREGLRTQARFPWYDAEQDDLRPVDARPATPPPELRDWNWSPAAAPRRRWNWNFNWGPAVARLLQFLAWGVLAVLFIVGIIFAIRSLLESELQLAAGQDALPLDELSDVERMEFLPFDVRRPATDLLSAARRQYELGNFGEATVYLFSYQLLQLDKHHWIRLAKGKTNRQYLREVGRQPDVRELLRQTMIAFEDFFFGQHAIERDRFESCWNRLDDFHRLVQPPGAPS